MYPFSTNISAHVSGVTMERADPGAVSQEADLAQDSGRFLHHYTLAVEQATICCDSDCGDASKKPNSIDS